MLSSGSSDNLRWQVTSRNTGKGTFNLDIRQGNDTTNRKQILESWNNVSMDPNSTNYVAKLMGDKNYTLGTDGDGTKFLRSSGSFVNKSKVPKFSIKL